MKEIKIVGGGIAGLSLGIELRQKGVPVTLIEAGTYPRHRVCGEFISGPGLDVMERLGLLSDAKKAGAIFARNGRLFIERNATPVRMFPQAALCISRYVLDDMLAERFASLGGILQIGRRQAQKREAGTVWATGRRHHKSVAGWKWYGLKVHAMGVTLEADLELHTVQNGYVGLCQLSEGVVNVCGLFRRSGSPSAPARPWREELSGTPGSDLNRRLEPARFVEASSCAVAGLGYRKEIPPGICAIGDTCYMTPPVTGNGMSMALESAYLACEPLTAYSRGECSWVEAEVGISRACKRAFSKRLLWGRALHRLFMSTALRSHVSTIPLRSALVWSLMFNRTRGL